MPLSFHLLENLPKAKEPKEKEYFDAYWTVLLTMAQLDGIEHLSSIIMSGACDRFPDFKFVLGEAGIGWIPYVIDRMDHESEGIKSLSMKPSAYWYRQGFSTLPGKRASPEISSHWSAKITSCGVTTTLTTTACGPTPSKPSSSA